ncbi:hypothetical protein [Streptomyces sp. NPDC003717]|uniref:hypothetical protein n=1 Tax=Streptomyces sp. NPDC003717 TaxID=3154276 RepID=UPI00339EFD50
MTRLCAHCDRPIKGEPRTIDPECGSGAAPTAYVHPEPCRPPRSRPPTTPTGLGA